MRQIFYHASAFGSFVHRAQSMGMKLKVLIMLVNRKFTNLKNLLKLPMIIIIKLTISIIIIIIFAVIVIVLLQSFYCN